MVQNMLLIGAGGFLGSVLRYGSNRALENLFDSAPPIGTLFVNIAGSFLIGIILGLFDKGHLMSANWKLFLAVGFCGGFTTFSSFALENLNFLQTNQFFSSLLYIGISIIAGLSAVYFGFWSVK